MAEIEQPNLDKDECPTIEPERGPESDSMDDERAQASVSETTSKASEPQPELLLLGKQLASSDQNEAIRGEASATATESKDSGEQFEVIQLSSFSKEKPCKEIEEGGTRTPPQDDGDKGEKSQDETKEPDREKEAYEENPAPQAEDQETIAPIQTEEGGADSGRTTPKEEESAVLKAERDNSIIQQQAHSEEEKQSTQEASETEVEAVSGGDAISISGGETNHTDREEEEEETDETMEIEASEVAGDRGAEGADGGAAVCEEQQQEGGDGIEEDVPGMETETRTDAESKGETESGDAVVSASDDAALPTEEDIQKEGGELSETKMEIESAADENVESTESEDVRKNEATSKDSIPPETDVETGNETATERMSPSEDDMETDAVPVKEETASVEASKQEETTTQDNSNLISTSPPPELEDKQVDPEPAKDNEGNVDMAEDRPPLTNRDEKEGGSEEGEKEDDDEQGLPLVQLGGATDGAPVEQEPDEGSVQKQEDGTVEGTLSTGDSTEAELRITAQDSELKEPVETVEMDDNFEKVESDIKQPERPMEPDAVEQRDEDEAFKLELSFESSEPETVPSKETSIHIPADVEKSELEKEPDEAIDEETAPSVPKGDQEQEVDSEFKSEMGTKESEEPADKMEVADSTIEGEIKLPDVQGESTVLQEPQATELAVVADQNSNKQAAVSTPVEDAQEMSGKTLELADKGDEATSSSPVLSEASDPKGTPSSDDSSNQPLPSTETSAPPPFSSTVTSAPAAGTASVGVSSSADVKVDTSTESTSPVKEAVTCTIKTTVTVSTPPLPHVDPATTSKAPHSSSEALPTSTLASTSTPSVAPPTTASSSSEPPSQAPSTTTPTTIETPSSSIATPTTTSPSSFKVPSLSNVPSLSSLVARSSALPRVLSTARASPTLAAASKLPSSVVQSTSDIGAKLPSFDTADNVSNVSLVPTITIPAVSESKSSSGISASAAKGASSMSTTAASSVSIPIPVAQLSSKAVSMAASPAMASSSTTTTPTSLPSPSSTTLLTSPSPSITTTAYHKSSLQQLLPSPASKPHANTISVITQLPASFTASKTVSPLSSVANSSAAGLHIAAVASGGGSHHGIVLGVGSLQQREQNIIIGMQGAERLKVGEAEILQVSGDSDLHLQQQKIEVKSREEMMGKVPPQVAVIPPIIDLTRTPEYSQMEKLKGKGVSGDTGKGGQSPSSILVGVAAGSSEDQKRGHSGEVKSVEKTAGEMAGQELKSPIGELKAAAHPIARRIWMSSCRPLDPASLERIGVDSKGTVYWYDGGKNMFQSPPSNDPAYKPSESELQLSCKSMVQWTAKLKELRHSNVEADMKLAQTIKDQFLSRVRIATQRKPRDMSVIQKLQAVHSIRPAQLSPQQQQQQQQVSISTKPTITLTTSQAAAAVASAGGAVAVATGGSGGAGTGADGITATQQKTAQIVQGSFPQGSILVVPHPTHPFHAVLPVFANTAVLMPQAAAAAAVATTTATASAAGAVVGSPPTASLVVSQSSTNDKKAKTSAGGSSEGAKVLSSVATAAAGAPQAILVQAPTTSQSLAALQASPSTVIQLSSNRNNVPVVSASEKAKEGAASKDRSTSSKDKPVLTEAVHIQQQAQKGGGIALTSPQTATIALHPSFLPQALASGMITALPGGGLKIQDYRQALALSAMMSVMPVKVGDPVRLSTIDFESKSIEISGEVPIKMVEVDNETGKLVPITKHPDLEQLRQKGVVVESERAPSSKEGEESTKAKKPKATDEESHVDVEEGKKKQEQVGADKAAKSHLAKEREEAFSGHSSSDIMSAQLLLSLTDGHHKDWSAIATPPMPTAAQQPPVEKASDSPAKSLLTKEASIVLTPVSLKSSGRDETASPASSTSQHMTASGGRKRKQKPIASAKPDDESATTTPTPKGKKGGRKAKQGAVQNESAKGESGSTEAKSSTTKKKQANSKTAAAATAGDKDTPGRSKQLTPEELLVLLDIPPSSSLTGKGSSKNKTPTAKAKGKAKEKSNQDGRYVLQSSNATAKMEQLKASRAGKPMKEYVIETDSDSAESSSSGTSSSRFSPDSGSSSESSSDSSSEEGGGAEGSEPKAKPPPKKVPARSSKGGVARGRGGRGRGGRAQRKVKKGESSSAESSSEDEEEVESKKKPTARARGGGVRGGRGGRGPRGAGRQETTPKQPGKDQRAGHIVSIPTNLLSHKPASGKKRKATSKVAEADKATTADYIPDLPVDLATLYATKGGVDLGTLSELTKSVKDDDIDIGIVGGSRSKRTCVRMREEISKLQEILKDNGSPEVRPSPPARSKTTSAGRASAKARSSSGRTSDVGGGSSGGQESTTVTGSLTSSAPARKYRRPAYSQFTHKRRKKRKKQPEEEALWQPASRKGGSGESYKPVYLFSTFLANKAAAAVEKNRYNSIIQFHQAQPKDPGFLRLPQTAEKQSKPQRGSVSDRKQTDVDSGGEEMSSKETKSTPRGQKRRNSGRTSEGGSATRRTRNSEVENADRVPSPQPFLRSSRRLRQQRNRSNASPPLQSPTSPDGPRSPLPPSPPSGVRPRTRKTSQNTAVGSGSAVQQRSQRRKRNNQQQHEESPVSPVPDLFETRRSQQVEEMDSPSDDEERAKDDEMSDGGIGARKRARFDDGEADKSLLSSPGMQSPEQQRSIPAPNSREEENYTICHGTPVNKSVGDDISSPKNWPPSSSSSHHHSQQQQMQNQQQLQHAQHGGQYPHHPHHHQQQQQQQMRSHEQQMQQYMANASAQPATGHAAQHHQQQPRAPNTPSSEATTFSPSMLHPESSSSPGFDHRSVTAAAGAGGGHATSGGAGLNSGGNGSGGRGGPEYAHRQHQLMSAAAEHAHIRDSSSSWATAGLHPHQFQSVPGAYPGAYPPMYNPASIPGMHYPGQPMPSANYPYPMPYHWGHHHPSAAAAAVPQLGEHMLQQQHHHHQQQQQHRQVATSKEMPSHHEVLQHPHISGHTPESPQSSSLLMRGGSSSAQSVSVTSSSTAAGKPSSRGHYPSPQAAALHQLTSPGSATTSHALSHQMPHGAEHLPPGAHPAAAAAAATFPYGFDSSAHPLSHMHMLQQSQMQPQLTRSLPGVPPHHIPPHMAPRGIWYSPQHMAAHQMIPGPIGAEIPGHPGHSKKAASKSSKSATSVDSDKNRNANNNNASIIRGASANQRTGSTQEFINAGAYKSPATVTYPSGAHISASSSSPGATFSIQNLTAPYGGAHVMGVSTTPHTPPTDQRAQRFGSNVGEGSLPAVSTILERTRQD